jgi:hypothetical protein
MPGTKGHSGGARPGAGRKPKQNYKTVELTEQAIRDLAYFIEDLNLDPREAGQIISTILSNSLSNDRAKWTDLYGNQLWQAQKDEQQP